MLQAHLPTHLLDRWATCVLPGRWIPLPANHVELSLHLRSHPRHPCCGETSAGLANIPHFGESGSAVRLLCSHACPLLETRERLSRLRARGWISTSPRGSNRICTTVPLLDSRPALGAQVRLGACEARLGATLGIECKGTKLGDSVTLSPSGNAQPRGRGGYPCLAPSREGSSPPRPAKTGLRYGAPPPKCPAYSPRVRVYARRTSEPHRAHSVAATAREAPTSAAASEPSALRVPPRGASGNGRRRPAHRSAGAPIGLRRHGQRRDWPSARARKPERVGGLAWCGGGRGRRPPRGGTFPTGQPEALAWVARWCKAIGTESCRPRPSCPLVWAQRPRSLTPAVPGQPSQAGVPSHAGHDARPRASARVPHPGGGWGETATFKGAPKTQQSRQRIF